MKIHSLQQAASFVETDEGQADTDAAQQAQNRAVYIDPPLCKLYWPFLSPSQNPWPVSFSIYYDTPSS